MRLALASLACALALHSSMQAQEPASADASLWVTYEPSAGHSGAGVGKHIVLVAGDEEYRSEEALPMLGQVLARHHGFTCTVLFSTNPETGEIDPNEQTNIPGLHLLGEADLAFFFLRFRELPDDQMRHIVDYVASGRPLIGMRTSTHAFNYTRNRESRYAHWSFRGGPWEDGFGRQILGETWVSHHGGHKSEATRGLPNEDAADHPVLRGLDDVFGLTDVYGVRNLPEGSTVLLWGQVLDGMEPDSAPVEGRKNDPMMPLAWVRELVTPANAAQRVMCSTLGASIDLLTDGSRRLFINSAYWCLEMEDSIPERSVVDLVGEYAPTMYGFNSAKQGVRASDHAWD